MNLSRHGGEEEQLECSAASRRSGRPAAHGATLVRALRRGGAAILNANRPKLTIATRFAQDSPCP